MASGLSGKALGCFMEKDKDKSVLSLIKSFFEPAVKHFADEPKNGEAALIQPELMSVGKREIPH
jgi:hypothetical protein